MSKHCPECGSFMREYEDHWKCEQHDLTYIIDKGMVITPKL